MFNTGTLYQKKSSRRRSPWALRVRSSKQHGGGTDGRARRGDPPPPAAGRPAPPPCVGGDAASSPLQASAAASPSATVRLPCSASWPTSGTVARTTTASTTSSPASSPPPPSARATPTASTAARSTASRSGTHHGRAAGASRPRPAALTFQLERGGGLRRPRRVRPPRLPPRAFLIVFLDDSGPEEMHVYVYSSEVGACSEPTYGPPSPTYGVEMVPTALVRECALLPY